MSNDKIKVLIADDEPVGRDLLEAILFPEGYNLLLCCDGEEAYNTTIEHQPDIILLDVMMPNMDGFEVCEKIRKNKEMSQIPIFLITALDDRDSRIKGIDAGANDYISKPFDRIEILAKIKNSLNLSNGRGQNKRPPTSDDQPTVNNPEDNMVLKAISDLHFSQEITNKNLHLHRSIEPSESSHAFFRFENNSKSYFFLISNSLNSKKTLLFNLVLKELLIQHTCKNQDSIVSIVSGALSALNSNKAIKNIRDSVKFKFSVLAWHYDKSANCFRFSGTNQYLFVNSRSESKEGLSRNSTYQTLSITGDKEIEVINPQSIFLFSSNVFETTSEQEINSFLDVNYSPGKKYKIEELADKFADNQDIIVVNYSI